MKQPKTFKDWLRSPFIILTASLLVLLFFVFPFEGGFGASMVPRLLVTGVLLAGAYAVAQRSHLTLAAVMLLAPPLVLTWGDLVLPGPQVSVVRIATTIAFFLFVAMIVLGNVMRTQNVTFDTIAGGLAVYLLMGLVFTEVYALILTLNPEAIAFASVDGAENLASIAYFSFVTLTTLGYGDIVPVSQAARAMASLEAVIGQVYLTVLVARLVGLHISQSGRFVR